MQVGRLAQPFEGEVGYLILINHGTFYFMLHHHESVKRCTTLMHTGIASAFIWVGRSAA
mgnify:CR=1 FL=1